jgi:hypothetical protein
MMKAIFGSALGGLAAGAVALVASAQGRQPETAWSTQTQAASPYAITVAAAEDANARGSNAVFCEPYQEAVLQRSTVAGREVAQVTCVTRPPAPAAYAAPVAAGYGAQPAFTPAYSTPDIVQRPAPRATAVRPRTQRAVSQRAEVQPKRSWKKSALVIGGAAGAGAGVGALAGGKKGALIGAAIGGGSGAIYEAIKRK